MTRLFGAYRCYVCNCVPDIGWIYTCTQDQESAADHTTGVGNSMAEIVSPAASADKQHRAARQMSGWIVEAIEDGHYTVEQVEVLDAQKRKVNETIAALEHPLRVEHGHVTLDLPQGASTSLPSVEINSRTPLHNVTNGAETRPTLSVSEQLARLRINLFPECRWSCCHTCRPTYRDRSWQSLEGVLASNSTEYGSTEFGERRVTAVNVARNLGLRKPRLIFDSFENLRSGSFAEDSGGSPGKHSRQTNGESEKQEGDDPGVRFRKSVKRAFRGMLMSRRRDSSSSGLSKKSAKPSSEDGGKTEEFEVRLWHEVNNQLLREAAEVRLPGGDGQDGLEFEEGEGEIEVEEGVGVAVTEEAVDLGTADIIISV